MTTVIDASAALAWCIPDEYDTVAEALLEHAASGEAIVPSLWLYEMQNALWSAQRRRRVSEMTARAALANLAKLPIRVADVPGRAAFGGESISPFDSESASTTPPISTSHAG